MKSKVASTLTWRTRSLRKTAAPFNTPTKITGSPAQSVVIWRPISATRWAICSRDSRILSSSMLDHVTPAKAAALKGIGYMTRMSGSHSVNENMHEPERNQDHMARSRDVSDSNSKGEDHSYRSVGDGKSCVPRELER